MCSRKLAFFVSWIEERGILMCCALVFADGFKNEVYSCVACFFRLIV